MNHSFSPNISEPTRCRVCGFNEIDHTDRATCECCGNTGNCTLMYNSMLMCKDCLDKEVIAQNTTVEVVKAEDTATILERNKYIEQSIHIQTDIFNAKMIAIVELKTVIDNDPAIENKTFKLAQVLDERYKHLKDVLFEKRKEIADNENEQRVIQTYYNELAKKLRADELAQIKLKDINYQPKEPTLKKPKAPSVKSLNKTDLILFANKLETEFPAMKGLVMNTLQTIVISQNVKPEGAYNILKGMLTKKETN